MSRIAHRQAAARATLREVARRTIRGTSQRMGDLEKDPCLAATLAPVLTAIRYTSCIQRASDAVRRQGRRRGAREVGAATHIPLTMSYSTEALLRDIHEAFL